MLKSICIKNIALIEALQIEFDKGLNVLTGETGAGKSIIIDSLNFVLGARTDKSLIRSGETSASVDAIFDISNNTSVKNILIDYNLETESELLISRTMNVDNRSDVRINGRIVTVSMLKEVTRSLVDIYGQQEQVALLQPKVQLALIDNFAGNNVNCLLTEYKSKLDYLKQINSNLSEYSSFENIDREKDYLTFVIEEISSAKINETEEEELLQLKHKLSNYEKIVTATTTMQNNLSNGLGFISQGVSNINNAVTYDESLLSIKDRLDSVKIELDDILCEINNYNQSTNFDEREFDRIDERLEVYKKLKRKYGNSVSEILSYLDKAIQKLEMINNSQNIINKLEKEKSNLLIELFDLSDKLDNARKQSAEKLSNKLTKELADLGMPNSKFNFNFANVEKLESNLLSFGMNGVEIMFSANLGQDLKPLSKVASGGELSRVMLALKSVVAKTDNMPTMIFDEIDSGISGKMSQAVSEKIANISSSHQVLVITHSAQIAAMADTNFVVEKIEKSGKTTSCVKKLSFEEKVDEIARFISVEGTIDISKNSALALINEQQKYKQN